MGASCDVAIVNVCRHLRRNRRFNCRIQVQACRSRMPVGVTSRFPFDTFWLSFEMVFIVQRSWVELPRGCPSPASAALRRRCCIKRSWAACECRRAACSNRSTPLRADPRCVSGCVAHYEQGACVGFVVRPHPKRVGGRFWPETPGKRGRRKIGEADEGQARGGFGMMTGRMLRSLCRVWLGSKKERWSETGIGRASFYRCHRELHQAERCPGLRLPMLPRMNKHFTALP